MRQLGLNPDNGGGTLTVRRHAAWLGNILVAAFRQSYCPPGMLGRAIAGMRFLSFGAVPVGALVAGSLGTALGVRNALWCALGLEALSGALLFTPAIVSRRDLPSECAPAADPAPPRTAARP